MSKHKQSERYPESRIQKGFITWFIQETDYVELYEDAITQLGTAMDSVGFIGGKPVLIEFKERIHRGMIRYESGREGNLEYKTYRAIRDLYRSTDSNIARALTMWDRQTPPELVFVAAKIPSDALDVLVKMLEQRAHEWQFGFCIYRWEVEKGICLHKHPTPTTVDVSQVDILEMKPLPATKRRPRLTLQDVRTMLKQKGLELLLDAMLSEMENRSIKVTACNVSNINFGRMRIGENRKSSLLGIWPYHSTLEMGMVVSMNINEFSRCFGAPQISDDNLPGIPAPIVGYLNQQRYLRSLEDVVNFWKGLAPVAAR